MVLSSRRPMKLLRKIKDIFKPIDMTKGSIYKAILVFLVPTILSMVFQQIYTLTDAIIVGQTLSESEVAGVNSTGSLVFIVLNFGIGCTSGFSVVIAAAIGANDSKRMRRSYLIQIILCFLVSVALTFIGIAMIPTMLGFLGIHESAIDPAMHAEYTAAATYLTIIFAGTIAQVFYNMIVSILRAVGDSFNPFLFLVASTILNVFLDLLFITVFHWGVAGSAFATVVSQGVAAIGAILYVYFRYKNLRLTKKDFHISWHAILRHIKNGFPLGFQYSVLAIGIIVMQNAVIRFDINPDGSMLASMPAQLGYGAASKIINLLMVPGNAIGTAVLAFTGQNYGANQNTRIKRGIKAAFYIGLGFYAATTIIGLLLTVNGAYQYLFLSAEKVTAGSIAYGNLYLYICVPSLIILTVLFIFRNALQGLEKPFWPLMSGFGELVARVLVCSFVPLLINGAAINSGASFISFVGAVLGDPIAWIISPLIALIPLLAYVKKLPDNTFHADGVKGVKAEDSTRVHA